MSKTNHTRHETEAEQDYKLSLSDVAPAVSAADAGPSARTVVRFDEALGYPIQIIAEQRCVGVNAKEEGDHELGAGSELATAAWADGEFNTEIYSDYEGDDGYDVIAGPQWGPEPARIEVKATRDMKNPERVISRDEIENIDYAVLCCSRNPSQRVDIVGYAPRGLLELAPDVYDGDGPLLQEEILHPMGADVYFPDDVRQVIAEMDGFDPDGPDATQEIEAV
jgi:hypothetical protein